MAALKISNASLAPQEREGSRREGGEGRQEGGARALQGGAAVLPPRIPTTGQRGGGGGRPAHPVESIRMQRCSGSLCSPSQAEAQ